MTTEAQTTEQQRRKLGELATAEQRLAADPTFSVWVNASAGTGKTKVLSDRVLRLLLAGVNPGRLLCLTYTKAAAVEMSARVSKKLSGWAVASEQDLENELVKLYGTLPQNQKQADELKARARKLFAVLLDTPGGIKIQTIHSFCQEILKRFPLEAGVSPYFEIMDDRAAAEAGEEIKNRLIAEIRGNPGSPAAEAMAFLTENVSELKFPEIIGTIINERGKISRLFKRWSSAGELLAAQAARLGVDPDADERELNRLFFDALPREELKTLLAAAFVLPGGRKNWPPLYKIPRRKTLPTMPAPSLAATTKPTKPLPPKRCWKTTRGWRKFLPKKPHGYGNKPKNKKRSGFFWPPKPSSFLLAN